MSANWLALVDAPRPDEVNGLSGGPCPTTLIARKRGLPRTSLTHVCQPPTDAWWRSQFVTDDVGPFRVTGFKPAMALFRAGFSLLERDNPEVYELLGSAGMLCCRHVRGRPGVPSNHSFGLAIDVTLGGVLDRRGDGKVQRGLFAVYEALKTQGIYWGVEFGVEDAMHFEIGYTVALRWLRSGLL